MRSFVFVLGPEEDFEQSISLRSETPRRFGLPVMLRTNARLGTLKKNRPTIHFDHYRAVRNIAFYWTLKIRQLFYGYYGQLE